jgi:hypothetical protein
LPPEGCDAHADIFWPFDRLLDLFLDRAADAGLMLRVLVSNPAALRVQGGRWC